MSGMTLSVEVIEGKILAGLKKPDSRLRYNGRHSFFLAYRRLMHGFTFKLKIRTTRNREVSIRWRQINSLYILWPIWLWPILIFRVADMVFSVYRPISYCCGRYGLWPIWSHPMCLYAELVQTKNKQCKSAVMLQYIVIIRIYLTTVRDPIQLNFIII